MEEMLLKWKTLLSFADEMPKLSILANQTSMELSLHANGKCILRRH